MFVTCQDGFRDLGMVLSQRPFGGPMHDLNLGIHPPEPIHPCRLSGCVRHLKAEILQIRIESLETPPRRRPGRIGALGVRFDVDAQNHRNAFIHSLQSATASPLRSPNTVRTFNTRITDTNKFAAPRRMHLTVSETINDAPPASKYHFSVVRSS
jgi:hypothetical protein